MPASRTAADVTLEVTVDAAGRPVVRKTSHSERGRERLRREASVLRALHHPCVARLVAHQPGTEGGERPAVLDLEWAGSSTLADVGPLSADAALRLAADLADGLAHLHRRGLTHRRLAAHHVVLGARPVLCGLGGAGPAEVEARAADVAALGGLLDLLAAASATRADNPSSRVLARLAERLRHPDARCRPEADGVADVLIRMVVARDEPVGPERGPSDPVVPEPGRAPAAASPDARPGAGAGGTNTEARAGRIPAELPGPADRAARRRRLELAERIPRSLPLLAGAVAILAALVAVAPLRPRPHPPGTAPSASGGGRTGPALERTDGTGPTSPALERTDGTGPTSPTSPNGATGATGATGPTSPTESPPAPRSDATPDGGGAASTGRRGPCPPPTQEGPAAPTGGEAATGGEAVGAAAREAAGGAAVADVDGDGCAEPYVIRGERIDVNGLEYRVGRPGDVVQVADWDCNGTATPAVVRPSTGEVFVFARWATRAVALTVPAIAVVAGARGFAAPDGAACPALTVTDADGRTTTLRKGRSR
ncbi:MAG: protein kinase [Actinobacteria bacterium]|nr:protein kinase [Actinomycetota bacterium]